MEENRRPPPAAAADPGTAANLGTAANEEVLVLPRCELVSAGLLGHGFTRQGAEKCIEMLPGKSLFLARSRAEEDPSFKQIIPYAVVTSGDRIFLFRRTSRGGEARLHGRHSIGVGGHIRPEGVPIERLIETGLIRELEEELHFDRPYRFRLLGMINDDEQPVGRVHIGLVYQVEVDGEAARVRERDVLEGEFVHPAEVRAVWNSLESWSKYLAEAILFGDCKCGALS